MRVRRRVRKPPPFKGDRNALRHIFSGGYYEESDTGYRLAQKIKDEFVSPGGTSVTIDAPQIEIVPPSVHGRWEANIFMLSAVSTGKGEGKRAFRHRRSAKDPEVLFKKIQELIRVSCNYVEIAPSREGRLADGEKRKLKRKKRGTTDEQR
jgi:hypothetical protein